jgi:hypothetical protein
MTMMREDYPKNFARRRDADLPDIYRWLPALYRNTAARLEKLERQAERQFPGVFQRLDQVWRQESAGWPSWCWMPISRVIEVIGQSYLGRISPVPAGLDLATGLSPEQLLSMGAAGDAARLAAIGAWRHAGRHVVNFHDALTAVFEQKADDMPVRLAERWPLAGFYMTFGDASRSAGLWFHLEWDAKEQRAELRLMMDMAPTASLSALTAQPLFLEGATVRDALERTWTATLSRGLAMEGSDKILDVSPAGGFRELVAEQARHVGVWAAAADMLASDEVVATDAASVLGREPAGEVWPPVARAETRVPLLWLVALRSQI